MADDQLPLYPTQRQTAKELPWFRQWLLEHGRGEEEVPTDQDLITDHPFQSGEWWPGGICHQKDRNGWICGATREEHGDKGGEAIEEP